MPKLKAVSITIKQAEGRAPLPPAVTVRGEHIWAKASGALSALGQISAEPDMLGVLKTDFTVRWEDGDDYSGTFGLTATDNDLVGHIRHHLSTDPALLKRLGHDPAYIALFASYADTHQIGDDVDADVPLRVYLDLKFKVISAREMARIAEAPPRVIVHEFGAWVHVPPDEAEEDPLDANAEDWDDFPNLRLVLIQARDWGAEWINLDSDALDTIPNLPTFED